MQPGETACDLEVRRFGVRCRAQDPVDLLKTRIAGKPRVLTIGRLAPDPAQAVADRAGERLRAMMAGETGDMVQLPTFCLCD